MRVAILHSRYLSGDLSGENRVVADEAALLDAAGHAVATLTPSARVESRSIALARDAIWSSRAVKEAHRLLEDFRPDVVHIHSLYPALSPAVLRLDAPIVMTLHNARLLCLPAFLLRNGTACELCVGKVPWRGVAHACYRGSRRASGAMATSLTLHRLLGTFDRVVLFLAVSNFVRDKHIEAGLDAERFRVKSNFVLPAKRRVGPGRPFVVVSRLAREKGVDVLLRAWSSHHSLEVVGDGAERAELERIAPSSVTFKGALPADDIQEVLSSARALLVPSRLDWLPRVVVEAFAAGVPVIASRVGGLPELVDEGVNGLLVEVDDADGWRAAADELLDDDESMRLGDGAFATWQRRHSPEAGLAELERAYADAMELYMKR